MKIYKFGGTSVGTVERMKHVAELISESTPKIVVLSATAGTTNHLEEIAANLFNRDIEQAHEKITRMEFQFIDFANELLTDESTKREAIDYILDRFQRLWQFINDEFTSIEEKEVLAQGELISTALLHFLPAGTKDCQYPALRFRLYAYRTGRRTGLEIYRGKTAGAIGTVSRHQSFYYSRVYLQKCL